MPWRKHIYKIMLRSYTVLECCIKLVRITFISMALCLESHKYIWYKWVKWVIGFKMPLAKVDDRGRVQLPSNLRHKMKLKEGDEFVAEDLGEDTIILKKINLRSAAGRRNRES